MKIFHLNYQDFFPAGREIERAVVAHHHPTHASACVHACKKGQGAVLQPLELREDNWSFRGFARFTEKISYFVLFYNFFPGHLLPYCAEFDFSTKKSHTELRSLL